MPNTVTALPTSQQLAAVEFDDRTPLGIPLPHPQNTVNPGDVLRLRAALIIADGLLSGIPSTVATEVAKIVGSAPTTLDTLRELADALGNDANFAATMTTALGGKASTTDLDNLAKAVGERAKTADVYTKKVIDDALALLFPKAGGKFTGAVSPMVTAIERLTSGTKEVQFSKGNVQQFTVAGTVTFNPTGMADGDYLQLNLIYESGAFIFAGTTQWDDADKSTNMSDLQLKLVAGKVYRVALEMAAGVRTGLIK